MPAWLMPAVVTAGCCCQALAASTSSPVNGATYELAEVVITAQRRRERLQDVPVSASVLSDETLLQAEAADISDLNKLVPSVEIKGTFNGRVPLAMRGMSTNAGESVIGLTSGVSLELDGVPISSDSFSANALDDIVQVEVLKGPQATLGGRTASAGVINFVTAAPTDQLQGTVSATLTNDHEQRTTLRVSGPLTPSVSVSLAAYDSRLRYPVKNDLLRQFSETENLGLRGKLTVDIGPTLDATVMGHYGRFTSRGANLTPQYLTPGAALFPFIPSAFDAAGTPTAFGLPQASAYPGVDIRYGNTHYASQVAMFSRYFDRDASLTLNYRIGGYTFTSIAAFQRETQRSVQDIFLSNGRFFDELLAGIGESAPPFDDTQHLALTIEQTSEELRVVSPTTGRTNFIAGIFYASNPVTSDFQRAWVAAPASMHVTSASKTHDLPGSRQSDRPDFAPGRIALQPR
jgi:iron complex outermembrane receptor protein